MYPTASAGSQLDLNHLWQQVQELSALLAANRETATSLVRRADEIRVRTLSEPRHGHGVHRLSPSTEQIRNWRRVEHIGGGKRAR